LEVRVIFPVCRVAASADLIRKMGGGGLLGSGRIARCLLTPHTPMLLFIYCFSFTIHFENYSVRGAAGFENILIYTTTEYFCTNRDAFGFHTSSEK
jgi:hypothetical protein